MRSILLADIHLGIHNLKIEHWLETHSKYFDNFFIPYVKNKKEDFELFIIGDLFDNRTYIDLRVLNYSLKLFEQLTTVFKSVHVLTGNHDILNQNSYENSALNVFKDKYSNLFIYSEPVVINKNNKKIGLLSWVTNKNKEKEILRNHFAGKCDYLLAHTEVAGFKNNLSVNITLDGHSKAEFVNIKRIFAGHFHLHQTIDNITYVGNPFHFDRNDINNRKGFYIVDWETGTEEFIENTYSPEFIKMIIKDESDVDSLERLIKLDNLTNKKDSVDRIDVIVHNSLLINKPIIRKKLEDITKRVKIESIHQFNDTEIKDIDEEINIDDYGTFNISEMIKDYVINQNYTSKETKEITLNILDDSFKTLKSEAK